MTEPVSTGQSTFVPSVRRFDRHDHYRSPGFSRLTGLLDVASLEKSKVAQGGVSPSK
jgi:hypothetical protein